MHPAVEALIALLFMLAGAGAGVALRRALPDHHLNEHTKDVVRLGSALVATIAALVLGLLINSASSSFEAQRSEVRQIGADLILLDAILEEFGPAAQPARRLLRESIAAVVAQVWEGDPLPGGTSPIGNRGPRLFEAVHDLPTATPLQRTLHEQALATIIRLSQSRLALFERAHAGLPKPIVFVLVFWLMALFASFSLFAPLNPTSIAALAMVALCAAAALYLILDMERPFTGLMRIPPSALTNALPPL